MSHELTKKHLMSVNKVFSCGAFNDHSKTKITQLDAEFLVTVINYGQNSKDSGRMLEYFEVLGKTGQVVIVVTK